MTADMEGKLLEAQQCLGCMHEGSVITSVDGLILDASIAAERILETPLLNLKGRNIQSFCGALDVYEEMVRKAASVASR